MALHLVTGDIPGLLSSAVTKIAAEAIPGARTLPVTDEASLLNELTSNSLWAEQQVIVLNPPSANFPKWLKENQEVVESSEDTIIVVSAKALAPLRKAVEAVGGVITEYSRRQYKDISSSMLRDSGLPGPIQKQINEAVGQEVERIPSIIASLKSLPESSLKYSHVVQAYLGKQGGVPMWGILDAIDSGDARKALLELARIKEPPIVVHAAIASHLQRIFEVSNLSGLALPEIAKVLGVKGSTFPLQKAIKLVGRYKNIERMTSLVTEAGSDLRGSSPLPDELILEILIGRLCLMTKIGQS